MSITVKHVSKKFVISSNRKISALSQIIGFFTDRAPKRQFEVLKDISFSSNNGEILGIIGKNGSGKSTLLRVIAGIYTSDSGIVEANGKIIPLISLNLGFIDRLSMRDNIYLCGCLFGMMRQEIRDNFSSIVKYAELDDFVDTKLYQFSSGMKQRLAFSIAVHCRPDILLIDEVFEIGDERFREKSKKELKKLVSKGTIILLVSHDLDLLKKHCGRILWIDQGSLVADGKTGLINTYKKQA